MYALTCARRLPAARIALTTAAAALVASVALPAVAGGTASAATVTPRPIVTGHALSGVVGTGGQSTVSSFGSWRGRPVDVVVNYLGTSTWASITGVSQQGLTGYWAGSSAHRVWSVPMLPLQESASLSAEASGAYNSKFYSVAQQLVAGGDGSSTIRLGWEMTGDWYTWAGSKDPAAFAEAWRQVVSTMRSVPGAHFTFDFNIAMGSHDPTPMYPGDNYVDFIGADNYDTSWASSYTPSDHTQVWNHILTGSYGLAWLANFASAHGKRMAFDEWGLSKTCNGHGGGDDPYFIQQFTAWMAQHDVAYEAYFERDYTSCESHLLTGGNFPNGANAYRTAVQSTNADNVHLGFETNNLSGWTQWHPSGQASAAGVNTASPHTGGSKLYLWSTSAFQQSVHMNAGMATPPGTYRVSAWFRLHSYSGAKPTTARMEVTHADGSSPQYVNLWLSDGWTYVSTTVSSPNAGLTTGFYLNAPGNTSLEIDDVTMQRA
ncbi:MAG: hypothetical protein QOE24_1055 [Frankiales bacterium]|nr:hypothetical protein [Frankiales bacterium]